MKGYLLIAACSASLVLSACGGASAEPRGAARITVQVPQTQAAKGASELLARAERAIGGYIGACARGEPDALSNVATSDLRVEYMLNDFDPHLSINVDPQCSALAQGAHVSNFWLFPTNDPSAVFVRYEIQTSSGSLPQQQLALIEMRGERIAMMRNFVGVPAEGSSVSVAASN